MTHIPKAPLWLGLAGLIPFVWGAVVTLGLFSAQMGDPSSGGYPLVIPADGPLIMIRYGTVILAFMSGVLWGFATRSDHAIGYVLSVIPALWAFGMIGNGPVSAATNLIFGFAGLLLLDWQFSRQGLTPSWWMPLRILLTTIVIICLLTAVI